MTDKIDMIYDSVRRLEDQVEKIDDKIQDVCVDVAKLKVKSGVWGAIAGIIPASVVSLYFWIRN